MGRTPLDLPEQFITRGNHARSSEAACRCGSEFRSQPRTAPAHSNRHVSADDRFSFAKVGLVGCDLRRPRKDFDVSAQADNAAFVRARSCSRREVGAFFLNHKRPSW
jgi:hypothetical protein